MLFSSVTHSPLTLLTGRAESWVGEAGKVGLGCSCDSCVVLCLYCSTGSFDITRVRNDSSPTGTLQAFQALLYTELKSLGSPLAMLKKSLATIFEAGSKT